MPADEPKVRNFSEISNSIKLEESQQEKRHIENAKERGGEKSTETLHRQGGT